MTLPRLFLRECRKSRKRVKVSDSTGTRFTGGTLLLRTLLLRRLLLRQVLAADEQNVGVLLPPSAGAAVVNAALTLARRVPVNLNYTVSPGVMTACLRHAKIRRVFTTRKVLERLKMQIDAELVYVDELALQISWADKLVAAAQAYLAPVGMLERSLQLDEIKPDDLMTIVFTSGSTGEPKGVMLSFRNIGSNVAGIGRIVRLNERDVLLGTLPFFHSFGYTTTLWTVLTLDPQGAYHYSPLEAQHIGRLSRENRVTIIISTPTFLRSYTKRCEKEDFAALEVVVAGAEKLSKEVCDAFEEKFGVRPVEGYGATELSPLVSVNIPSNRAPQGATLIAKEGTVGRPIPETRAKIVDLDSGQTLGADQSGMLWITGPNVMQGYLDRPDLTSKVIADGWYKTGDVAKIDSDGFITITGRESRFSKIGGEMVPHIRVEEELQRIIAPDADEVRVAVTAVPDPRKGERLIVIHLPLEQSPEELIRSLQEAGLPNIWIPSPDSFCQIDEMPLLGTGKLDLRALNALAREKFGKP